MAKPRTAKKAKKQVSEEERESDNLDKARSIIQRWYYGEARRWAQDFAERIRAGEFSDREDFREKFDEETDGSQIVIYTQQARMALLVSKYDDAYMEEMGEAPDPTGPMFYETLALFAFRRDILDALSEEDIDVDDDATFESEEESDED